MRLRSDLLVSGIRRLAESQGAFVTVRHKGHEQAGVVFVVIAQTTVQCEVWQECHDPNTGLSWVCCLQETTEANAAAYLAKQHDFDPDLWVVDIEGVFSASELPTGGVGR